MILINKKKILTTLDRNKNNNLIILVGESGGGKKTALKLHCKANKMVYVGIDNKIDSIREIITIVEDIKEPLLVCIEEGNGLSIQAQNTLLKISEEPPKNVNIVICVTSFSNLLTTTLSRGTIIFMPVCSNLDIQTYTKKELERLHGGYDNSVVEKISNICSNFGDVNTIINYNIDDFNSFCLKVLNNILHVSTVNAFRIGRSLKLRDIDIGYDFAIFLKTLKSLLFYFEISTVIKVAWVKAINKALSLLGGGENKQAIFDNFILSMRDIK